MFLFTKGSREEKDEEQERGIMGAHFDNECSFF
jgi:hypothetical protein